MEYNAGYEIYITVHIQSELNLQTNIYDYKKYQAKYSL